MHDAIPYRPLTMSPQPMAATQPFAPGMSRLERLPDELKLRIGCFLTAPYATETTRKRYVAGEGDDDELLSRLYPWQYIEVLPDLVWNLSNTYDTISNLGNNRMFNDAVLALASTSSRLCNVFLVEHAKQYGLQNTLFRSIELGHVSLVQSAVEYGADINKPNTKAPWKITPLQLAVELEQLPIILYLLRRGVDKVDELVMDILRDREYHRRSNEEDTEASAMRFNTKNHCLCDLLHGLMNATLGSSQGSHTGPRLPRETLEALVPTGQHLWFILRTCMRRDWKCDCAHDDIFKDNECPMRLISLLRRHGAKWMPCGAYDDAPWVHASAYDPDAQVAERDWAYDRYLGGGRGMADLRRLDPPFPHFGIFPAGNDPKLIKPSVAGAMDYTLLFKAAYRRDHCVPFLVAMLEHGVTAEQGDLSCAMDLASEPDTKQLSIAIVVALLRAGTNPNEPGAMKTAMRLACMEATKDAAVAFVTLLLEHGADPGAEELQDEIQGAAEKWWMQSTWQSSEVFCRILRLLVEGGLDEHIGREILAVLGLDHDFLAKEEGGVST